MADTQSLSQRRSRLSPAQRAALSARIAGRSTQADSSRTRFEPRENADRAPLSSAQNRLWFHWQMEPAGLAYHQTDGLRFVGRLDIAALHASLDAIVERHAALRTIFEPTADGGAEQVILPASSVDLPLIDLESCAEERESQLASRIHRLRSLPFDLTHGPLLRLALFRLSEDVHQLLVVIHHIVADGRSTQIVLDELSAQYRARVQGRTPEVLPAPVQYGNYAHWERQWSKGPDRDRQLAWWLNELGTGRPSTTLPFEKTSKADDADGIGQHLAALPDELVSRLRTVTRNTGGTLFMAFLTAFHALLWRYGEEDETRVGVPSANRSSAETAGIVGFFVNMHVLQARIVPRMTLAELLRQTRDQALGAQANQDLPFEQLVEALRPERSVRATPLFDVTYNHLRWDYSSLGQWPGVQVERCVYEEQGAQFDLTLETTEYRDGKVEMRFRFAAGLFPASAIERMSSHYVKMLAAMADNADAAIADVDLSGHNAFPETRQGERTALPVHEMFAQQAAKAGSALALICGDRQLTYRDLDQAVATLASRLVEHGVDREQRVAIHCERSTEFVISLLAVLRAGGAYVPLDPQLPAERLRHQLLDSSARLVLSPEPVSWADGVPLLDPRASEPDPVARTWPSVHPDQCAYVIYTSGSTGQPKGVAVTHGALANYVAAMLSRAGLGEAASSMAMVSSVAADLGNTTLFGALCSAGALHLISTEIASDPDRFADYMQAHRVDVLKIAPSHLRGLLSADRPADVLPARVLLLGGEASAWTLIDRIADLAPECRVLNHYGPTETTVGALMQPAGSASRYASSIPIGTPLSGVRCHVLDAHLNRAPQGIPGELYLGGAALARGYVGKTQLTSERFVASPFDCGERLYRTSDRVRVLTDGSLEFLGRTDDQVKVRGYRVEPREVAQALKSQPGVNEAEVIAQAGEDGRTRLYGYVVPAHGSKLDVAALRQRLAASLPDYMIPSAIIELPALPFTSNGKLDRRALPAPAESARAGRYEPPVGQIEAALAAIWSSVLKVERVGRHDNFFELGGDSMLALWFIASARQHSLHPTLKQLFRYQVLSALAAELSSSNEGTASTSSPTIPLADRTQPLLLSAAQSRQWFLWKMDEKSSAYHVSSALKLTGTLDLDALKWTLATLVQRHEALRTTIRESAPGVPEQVVHTHLEPSFEVITLLDEPIERRALRVSEEAARTIRAPFNLSDGPLVRLQLMQLAADETILLVVLHHIISDGWSMQVIVDEFVHLYRARLEGREPGLKALPIQYADYAAWHSRWLAAGEMDRQLAYWQDRLGTVHPVLQMPTDRPRKAEADYEAAVYSFELTREMADGLARRAREHRATLFMVLLTGLQALLHRYTEQNDIRLGMTNSNRIRPETQGVVGFFVNTQVLRSEIRGGMSLIELLEQVSAAVVDAQEHQDLPFEKLVEVLRPERSLSHLPLFQVMVNHQRRDSRGLATLPGLAFEWYEPERQAALCELLLNTTEHPGEGISVSLTYAAELFDEASIAQLARHYVNVLQSIVDQPECRVRDIALLDERDGAVRHRMSARRGCDEPDQLPHRRIEEHARLHPSATAVTCDGVSLSYAELNRRANRIAHRLIAMGVRAETRVGLAMERSAELIVGLLAILKAGGAYVPLDPQYPEARLSYMMRDSGIAVLLTQTSLAMTLPAMDGIATLMLDAPGPGEWSDADPQPGLHPDNLAYVIYTSGSTGQPKGAQLCHRHITRLLRQTQTWFQFDARDVWTMFHSCAFDFSVWEIFGALCHGGRLVVVPYDISRSPEDFLALLRRERVTVLNQTPSAFRQLLQVPGLYTAKDESALRVVIFGGEALDPPGLRPWVEHFGDSRPQLINMYGITETTVHVTYRPVVSADLAVARSPIGEPIADLDLRVLDSSLNAVPAGVPGELYVSGAGLARGYLNRAALTATRFVADPASDSGERMYRTGDLVRRTRAGDLEYVGRADHQVKIRGFRIELGEIEAQLLSQAEVREAAVLVQERDGERRLLAYVVPAAGQNGDGNLVAHWETVFDNAYESEGRAPSFRGWNSSYDDAPIPEIEMQEWLESTLNRIRALRPGRMIEIGCGVGLLLQHLAWDAQSYVGTDLSARAVTDLRVWLESQPALAHVEVKQAEATNLGEFARGDFDTAILNSVVQYLPDVDYLVSVLREAARVVGPQGRIFVGDLRHLAHRPMFHASVQLSRASPQMTLRQLRSRIARAIAQDKELMLDPAFFDAVATSLGMSPPRVLLRRGHFDNELTRYRYDVVLGDGNAPLPESRQAPESQQSPESQDPALRSLDDIESHLCDTRPAAFVCRRLQNLRMARDLAAWRLIRSMDEQASVSDVLARLDTMPPVGIDPESLWALGEQHGYDVHVSWSRDSADGELDVEFIERSRLESTTDSRRSPVATHVEMPRGWRAFASDPTRALFLQQLGPRLRARLLGRLPDYMVPGHFMVLDSFPLNANGKLDRQALPEPEVANTGHYAAPLGQMEESIAAIWSEVLGVERIGRHDNFFELGGHSLLAMKVIAQLRSRLLSSVRLRDLFEAPTVAELVQLTRAGAAQGSAGELAEIDRVLAALES